MKYTSTRGQQAVSATYALIHGLAEDGGLYVPTAFPKKSLCFKDIENKSYEEIAVMVMRKFISDFTEEEWQDMVQKAYNSDTFDTPEIIALHDLEENFMTLELFHGRTVAFKDLALSLFPHTLVAAKEKEQIAEDLLILTATSGDTGKAALEGFKNVDGTYIQVFYPTDGVSPMQKEQMEKQQGANVDVVAIRGTFDDAQQFLKRVFVDPEMRKDAAEKGFLFSSANSINIGRLLPQVVYYVKTYEELVGRGVIAEEGPFNVVVPTGNFGNILAAYYAKMMGVPIGRCICASNENKVLSDFFKRGVYNRNRQFVTTLSPSMDILESSNFERFIYYMFEEDTEKTAAFMEDIKKIGEATVEEALLKKIQKEFYGATVSDDDTVYLIREIYDRFGYLVDPHTAVAIGAAMQYEEEYGRTVPTVIVSTAHPFKFPTALAEAMHIPEKDSIYDTLEDITSITGVAFPQQLLDLKEGITRFSRVEDKENMRKQIWRFMDSIGVKKGKLRSK